MSETKTSEEEKKLIRKYQLFVSLPILFAIVHMIGQLMLQNMFSYADGVYSGFYGLSFTFGGSYLSTLICSYFNSFQLTKELPSVIAIAETLVLIFLSSSALRKQSYHIRYALLAYGIDTLLALAGVIVSFFSPLNPGWVYALIMMLVHILGMGGLFYAVKLAKVIEENEAKKNHYNTEKDL